MMAPYNQFGNGSAIRLGRLVCRHTEMQVMRFRSVRRWDAKVGSPGNGRVSISFQRGDLAGITNGDGTVDHVAFFLSPTERFDASRLWYATPNGFNTTCYSIDKIVGGGSF